MGANESKDSSTQSIVNLLIRFLLLIFHFAFVIVSNLLKFLWRPLTNDKGLQAELDATNKEGEFVRLKLKSQDAQLEKVKEKQDVSAAEDHKKYGKLIDGRKCSIINNYLHKI